MPSSQGYVCYTLWRRSCTVLTDWGLLQDFPGGAGDSEGNSTRRSLPSFPGSGAATTVLGSKVSNVFSRMRASVSGGNGGGGTGEGSYQ